MTTASAWKNFRRAFRPSVGTRLSAASRSSVAAFAKRSTLTFVALAPLTNGVEPDVGTLVLSLIISKEGAPGTTTPELLPFARWRYLRALANCRFQPATLRLPNTAQYPRSATRLQLFRPSSSQNTAHNHGLRWPKHQRVHMPMRPPTISAASA